MPTNVDRAGTFRGNIVEYGLKEVESGSVAVTMRVQLNEMWNDQNKDWDDWAQYDQEAHGDVWIIKKDKTPNQNAVTSLCRNAGWDGNIESIQDGKWQPNPVQVVIVEDHYNGETRMKISFINDFYRTPGGLGANMTPEKAKQLQMQFGSALRAIAGNSKRDASKPNGAPASPPPRQYAPPPPPANRSEEEIPF